MIESDSHVGDCHIVCVAHFGRGRGRPQGPAFRTWPRRHRASLRVEMERHRDGMRELPGTHGLRRSSGMNGELR